MEIKTITPTSFESMFSIAKTMIIAEMKKRKMLNPSKSPKKSLPNQKFSFQPILILGDCPCRETDMKKICVAP
jgi:hypothetical protein